MVTESIPDIIMLVGEFVISPLVSQAMTIRPLLAPENIIENMGL